MAGEISDQDKAFRLEDYKPEGANDRENAILRYTIMSRQEAQEAKRERMLLNRKNYDYFNLKADFTHKKKGQSREFLPKQRMSVLQLVSFIMQSIVDAGEWFSVHEREGVKNPIISAHEMKLLLKWALDKQNFPAFIDDSLKSGVLGSIMTCKVHGTWTDSYEYEVENEIDSEGRVARALYKKSKKVWEPRLSVIRQEDWFPDPTGGNLFDIQQIEMDLHKVRKLAEGEHAIYNKEAVDKIVGGFEDLEQQARKARETGQLMTFHTARKRVRIWECYGTILDPSTGDVIMENAMWTVCNDRFLIQPPIPNPFWHGKDPIVATPIIRVPNSTWHGALADSMSDLNQALNELFNLMLDSGLMSTWGIRQSRPEWMADDTKYADGIGPGETIETNAACPPGGKVLEPVQTSEPNPEGNATYQLLSSEFQQASMTNDLRMGTIPNRDVRATEIVEANQSIGSLLNGIAKIIESDYLIKVLEKSWLTIAQHLKDIDREELVSMFGEDRANELLALGSEEIFRATVKGKRFKVFGISETMSKMKDFRKMTALLQTIGSSEVLIEEFVKRYDFGLLLEKIMRALDIDTAEIEHPKEEQAAMAQSGQGAAVPGQGGPNMQSQIPQMGSVRSADTGNGIAQPAALLRTEQYANAASHMNGGGAG